MAVVGNNKSILLSPQNSFKVVKENIVCILNLFWKPRSMICLQTPSFGWSSQDGRQLASKPCSSQTSCSIQSYFSNQCRKRLTYTQAKKVSEYGRKIIFDSICLNIKTSSSVAFSMKNVYSFKFK